MKSLMTVCLVNIHKTLVSIDNEVISYSVVGEYLVKLVYTK